MGGVDLTEQNLSYYSMSTRKTLKWWKKAFWRYMYVDIRIINSWIIFQHNNPQSPINTQRLFCLKLIEELAQLLLDLQTSPDCPPYIQDKHNRVTVLTENRLNGKHFAYKKSKQRCTLERYNFLPIKPWWCKRPGALVE